MKLARLLVRCVLLGLAGWGFVIEPSMLRQRQLQLAVADWQGPPLTIALASDLHIGAPHAGLPMLRRVVDQLNASQPDLILLPGDFVIQGVLGGDPVSPAVIATELGRLKAPLGVFATLGNHDWWHGEEDVRQALSDAGITVLENSAIRLPGTAAPLWLVGFGDDMTDHAQPEKALAMPPADARLIVMMHDPANASALPARTLVAFAGHTHGGQVRLPFYGALLTPGRAPRKHAYGWIPDVPAPTFVSAGVGTSILPVRFNCPPETLVLRLGNKELS